MNLNFNLWYVLRQLYALGSIVIVPFLMLFWIFVIPKAPAYLYFAVTSTLVYLGVGWFLLSFIPKKHQKDILRKVDGYKAQGYIPSTFEMYSRYNNRYIGWSKENDYFLLISMDEKYERLGKYGNCLEINLEGNRLIALTEFREYPKAQLVINQFQRNYAEAEFAKIRILQAR